MTAFSMEPDKSSESKSAQPGESVDELSSNFPLPRYMTAAYSARAQSACLRNNLSHAKINDRFRKPSKKLVKHSETNETINGIQWDVLITITSCT